jgi:hypothetical protein
MARVLLFGAAWIALLIAMAVAVARPTRGPSTAGETLPVALPPPAPPPRTGERYPGWTVTRAYSAHHVMIVEVETDTPAIASSVASQIVQPLKNRYDEVLIYVREPGQRPDDLPARRIQWTPRNGYVESVYAR